MGFIFGVIGAIAGGWAMSEGRQLFGVVAGMFIGWLVHRLVEAQNSIRRLQDRVDTLEQRNEALAPVEKVARKSFDTPPRVSIYEPAHVETPKPAAPAEPLHRPGVATAVRRSGQPEVIVHETTEQPVSEPGMGAHAIEVAKRWLTTGNVPVKVGVLLSFFGVAFLLKYAVEQELFSIPMSVRYLAVAGFATFLLVFGWRKREDNRVFALSIQGGGIGVL
ncbi:MAG: DUF2339 domain-containing protein, partial [Gammaproteobacteria bacterium]|nr:DUF2339 domain-containing protein [Gammaproteobacteria bacterium]